MFFDLGDVDTLSIHSGSTIDFDLWGDLNDDDLLAAYELVDEPVVTADTEPTTPALATRSIPAQSTAAAPSSDSKPAKPITKPGKKPTSSFAKLTEEDLLRLEEAKDEKSTKASTSWGVKRFKGDYYFLYFLRVKNNHSKSELF